MEQLEGLVEPPGVGARGVADGQHPGDVAELPERTWDSRARIQFSLPRTVLISPLCASIRYGCASGQEGKVFVENREWTIARAEATRSSWRSR